MYLYFDSHIQTSAVQLETNPPHLHEISWIEPKPPERAVLFPDRRPLQIRQSSEDSLITPPPPQKKKKKLTHPQALS